MSNLIAVGVKMSKLTQLAALQLVRGMNPPRPDNVKQRRRKWAVKCLQSGWDMTRN